MCPCPGRWRWWDGPEAGRPEYDQPGPTPPCRAASDRGKRVPDRVRDGSGRVGTEVCREVAASAPVDTEAEVRLPWASHSCKARTQVGDYPSPAARSDLHHFDAFRSCSTASGL